MIGTLCTLLFGKRPEPVGSHNLDTTPKAAESLFPSAPEVRSAIDALEALNRPKPAVEPAPFDYRAELCRQIKKAADDNGSIVIPQGEFRITRPDPTYTTKPRAFVRGDRVIVLRDRWAMRRPDGRVQNLIQVESYTASGEWEPRPEGADFTDADGIPFENSPTIDFTDDMAFLEEVIANDKAMTSGELVQELRAKAAGNDVSALMKKLAKKGAPDV